MYDTEPRLCADQFRYWLKDCLSAQNPDKADSVRPLIKIQYWSPLTSLGLEDGHWGTPISFYWKGRGGNSKV